MALYDAIADCDARLSAGLSSFDEDAVERRLTKTLLCRVFFEARFSLYRSGRARFRLFNSTCYLLLCIFWYCWVLFCEKRVNQLRGSCLYHCCSCLDVSPLNDFCWAFDRQTTPTCGRIFSPGVPLRLRSIKRRLFVYARRCLAYFVHDFAFACGDALVRALAVVCFIGCVLDFRGYLALV